MFKTYSHLEVYRNNRKAVQNCIEEIAALEYNLIEETKRALKDRFVS